MLSTQINSGIHTCSFCSTSTTAGLGRHRPQSPSPDLLHIKKEEAASSHIQVQLRPFYRSVNAPGRPSHVGVKSAARPPPLLKWARRGLSRPHPLPFGDDMTQHTPAYPAFTFSAALSPTSRLAEDHHHPRRARQTGGPASAWPCSPTRNTSLLAPLESSRSRRSPSRALRRARPSGEHDPPRA